MSTSQPIDHRDTNCYLHCLNGFINKCPELSKSSKSICKIASIFAALTFTLGLVMCAMMLATHPQMLLIGDWHWTQIAFFSLSMGGAGLLTFTAYFFSSVNARMRESSLNARMRENLRVSRRLTGNNNTVVPHN